MDPQSGCFRAEGRSRVLEDEIREVGNDENVRLV